MNGNNLSNDYNLIKIKEKILEINGPTKDRDYYVTPFLPLSYQYEIEKMLKHIKPQIDIYYFNSGERKVAILGNISLKYKLNPIRLLKIKTNDFLKHSDIMGAILNIGLKREVIGNIYTNRVYLVEVLEHIEDYVVDNLNNISCYRVKVEKTEDEIPSVNSVIKKVIVSSYRLDNVVSSVFNISRELSKKMIINKDVQLNFNNELEVDKRVSPNSYLSCKRHGKVFIIGEVGKTKKDNIILEVKYF